MTIQTCNRCRIPKDVTEFYLNPSGQSRRKICKQCFKVASDAWTEKNRDKHNARAMKWYRDNPLKAKAINARGYQLQNGYRNEIMSSIFNDYPCLACGEKRHGCLSFHHLDPSKKESSVLSHSLTWKNMLLEAAKCVVLCMNCHMLYHRGQITLPKDLTPIDTSKYKLMALGQIVTVGDGLP
jgi:hypothetical protein